MLEFKPIELEDKGLFDKFFYQCPFYLSTYSFSNLFMWRRISDVKYTVFHDCLIILKKDFNGCYHFIEPLNIKESTLKFIVDQLIIYGTENNFDFLFKDISLNFALKINNIYRNKIILSEDPESFDYIYMVRDLVDLKGNRYKSQRNHYNHFLKSEKFSISGISDHNIRECCEMLDRWAPSHKNITAELEKYAVLELLDFYPYLDLYGMTVYVNKILEGFAIGEKIKPDMAVIHVEKANSKINGIYSYINKTFLEKFFTSVFYVNREEDLGIKNLRDSKLSYHPIWLEPSYMAVLLNDLSSI